EPHMNLRSGSCFLLSVCWLIAAGAVHAESVRISSKERQSHIPLPAMRGAPEVTLDAFQKQLDQLALQDLLQKVAKDPEKFGLNQKDIDSVKPKHTEPPNLDLNDKKVQELIKKLYQQQNPSNPELGQGSQIPPAQLET